MNLLGGRPARLLSKREGLGGAQRSHDDVEGGRVSANEAETPIRARPRRTRLFCSILPP